MPQFQVRNSALRNMRDRVVVLTGGASGIGAATVEVLHSAGAQVYFGDVSVTAGESYAASLGERVHFHQCDTTSHREVYNLFRAAYDAHGHVDHAIACAGVLEQGDFFSEDLTIESLRNAGDDENASRAASVLHTNLEGTALFARIAVVFLKDGISRSRDNPNRSLTLLASVASIREAPGMYMYQASKHGILGLMRSMRRKIHERDGLRINTVCPGMTESAMTKTIIGTFREKGLSTQTSEDVARVIVAVQVEGEMNGKSFYVENGTAWEFEDGVWNEMNSWLGEEPTKLLKANSKFVNEGGLNAAITK